MNSEGKFYSIIMKKRKKKHVIFLYLKKKASAEVFSKIKNISKNTLRLKLRIIGQRVADKL